jgi:hypothetical protein
MSLVMMNDEYIEGLHGYVGSVVGIWCIIIPRREQWQRQHIIIH